MDRPRHQHAEGDESHVRGERCAREPWHPELLLKGRTDKIEEGFKRKNRTSGFGQFGSSDL